MSERELKVLVENQSEIIAKILKNGNDCEIRKLKDGISVVEVRKKVVSK